MKKNVRQMLAYVFGALFIFSGSAIGQDAARPWMEPSQGSRQDTMQDKTGSAVDSLQDSVQGSSGEYVEPDNTGVNMRDRNEEEATADDQGQSSTDIEMTRKIRQAIMDDDSLSTYAKNIKIITKDGMVTLKGPVRSQEEMTAIEAKAAAVAGAGKITNQIEVKTATSPEND